MNAIIKGMRTSWTLWFGVLLLVWGPDLQTLMQPFFAEWFGDETASKLIRVIGIVVMLLRAKTEVQKQAER